MNPLRVLVTGADQRQGLAAIRALGRAGASVIAGGAQPRSLGFYSRYAAERAQYRSPFRDLDGSGRDLLDIVKRTKPDVVLPAVESTLVATDRVRETLEANSVLGAAPRPMLDQVIDKLKTVRLAEHVGVPVPCTASGETAAELLRAASQLRFPVAVKPRGHRLWWTTAHRLDYKVRYAASPAELADIVREAADDVVSLLVQEYVGGTGRCVAAVCDDGKPLAMVAYERTRELPLTGGVSVMRRTIPLDHSLTRFSRALLERLGWRGVAMVEFKYDPLSGHYTLMEINGRLQASTALAVDAGVNLPFLAASLFAGRSAEGPGSYAVGVEERWLRGDLSALLGSLRDARRNGGRAVVRPFVRDFRRGVRYDEFRRNDWMPGVVEAGAIVGVISRWMAGIVRSVIRRSVRRWRPAAVPRRESNVVFGRRASEPVSVAGAPRHA